MVPWKKPLISLPLVLLIQTHFFSLSSMPVTPIICLVLKKVYTILLIVLCQIYKFKIILYKVYICFSGQSVTKLC